MNSDEYPFNPDQRQLDDQPEQSPENRIHPDTLKFMGMAKELLDSPVIQQSIEAEQQKDEADSTVATSAYASNLGQTHQSEFQPNQPAKQEEQPDTLNFMNMAKDLLKNSANQQSVDPK